MNDLWGMITENSTMHDYYWAEFNQIFTNGPTLSYCQDSDEITPGRLKVTHTQGLVAKVKWEVVPNTTGYTGFYAATTEEHIIRFSQTSNLTELSGGLLPSFALKFLITGQKSQNIFGMPSFKETDSWDFFKYDMKTRLDHFIPADENGENDQMVIDTLRNKLNEAHRNPFTTTVGNIGDVNAEGDDLALLYGIDSVKVPYELVFTSDFKDHVYTEEDGMLWVKRLKEIGTD